MQHESTKFESPDPKKQQKTSTRQSTKKCPRRLVAPPSPATLVVLALVDAAPAAPSRAVEDAVANLGTSPGRGERRGQRGVG